MHSFRMYASLHSLQNMSSFEELVRVLEQLCKPLDNADLVSFEAAIAFGKICVKNAHAVEKMLSYLNTGDDTHKKAVVIEMLWEVLNDDYYNPLGWINTISSKRWLTMGPNHGKISAISVFSTFVSQTPFVRNYNVLYYPGPANISKTV